MGLIVKNDPLTRTDIGFQSPTQIKFGVGKVANLSQELEIEDDLAERNRVVVVTDASLVRLGLLDRVRAGLANSNYEIVAVFDAVPPDSDVGAVESAAALLIEHHADLVIAAGGGSVMDTAKAASILATHGGRIHDYEGLFMVPGPCTPIVAIPTTCGTGSEVTSGVVIKDHEARTKIIMASPYAFPRLAVLDPELLKSLPAHLVAFTGMDAMTHAFEAFVSTEREPFTEAMSVRAVELLADNLPAAVEDRDNIDALSKVQIAAAMGGIAFTNAGVGAAHAVAHAVGSLHGKHHGLSNAIALPYVMEYNIDVCPERYAALATALGVERAGRDDSALARAAVARIRELCVRIGIPRSFAEIGIASDDATIEELAEAAMNDPCLAFNPRPTEFPDMEELVRKCVTGAL